MWNKCDNRRRDERCITARGENLALVEPLPLLRYGQRHDGDGILGPKGEPGERVWRVDLQNDNNDLHVFTWWGVWVKDVMLQQLQTVVFLPFELVRLAERRYAGAERADRQQWSLPKPGATPESPAGRRFLQERSRIIRLTVIQEAHCTKLTYHNDWASRKPQRCQMLGLAPEQTQPPHPSVRGRSADRRQGRLYPAAQNMAKEYNLRRNAGTVTFPKNILK